MSSSMFQLKRSLEKVIMNIIGYYLFIIVSMNSNNDVFKYVGWGLRLSKINNKPPTNPTPFFLMKIAQPKIKCEIYF